MKKIIIVLVALVTFNLGYSQGYKDITDKLEVKWNSFKLGHYDYNYNKTDSLFVPLKYNHINIDDVKISDEIIIEYTKFYNKLKIEWDDLIFKSRKYNTKAPSYSETCEFRKYSLHTLKLYKILNN